MIKKNLSCKIFFFSIYVLAIIWYGAILIRVSNLPNGWQYLYIYIYNFEIVQSLKGFLYEIGFSAYYRFNFPYMLLLAICICYVNFTLHTHIYIDIMVMGNLRSSRATQFNGIKALLMKSATTHPLNIFIHIYAILYTRYGY